MSSPLALSERSESKGMRGAVVRSERGLALLVVMAFIAFLTTLVFEFNSTTTIDTMAAANHRDSMRAHFLNRSGANLAKLIIKVQTDVLDKFRNTIGDIQLADYASLFMGAFGGSGEEVEAIGELLGGFQADAIEGLGVSKRTSFSVDISTEDGKLNMNCANGSQATRKNLQTQLEALVYFDVYNKIFEEETAEGWRRTREEQVAALMDYIDQDKGKANAPGTSEEYGYESLDDDYLPKNNYLDSVGELKLVRGVDDRFWTLFGSEFTVYGDCKVNIGAIQDPKLIASVIFLAAKNPEDPTLRDPNALWRLAKRVAEARQFGVYFDDLNAFADFVKNPDGSLGELLTGADGQQNPFAQQAAQAAQGLEPVVGVELDPQKLGQVAQSGPRRTYRVEVTAEILRPGGNGSIQRHLTAIWDTKVTNQQARNPAAGTGAWVFWREE